MNTIRLFMWGYQRHFQVHVQHWAEELFAAIDPDLEVQTFLLGLLREPDEESHPVCLEPEECGFGTHQFGDVLEDAEHHLAVDGEANLMTTHPGHYQSIQRRRRSRAERQAVLKALTPFGRVIPTERHYFSGFIDVASYQVGVVLILRQRHKRADYSLPKTHAEYRYQVPDSLIEATSDEFLQHCLHSLYVPHPETVAELSHTSKEETLRKAGSRLMEAPNFATGSIEGLYGLYHALCYIASLTYEGINSQGRMIIAHEQHENVEFTVRLRSKTRLSDYRAVRKLLELTSPENNLISDGTYVLGTGKRIGAYDQSQSDLFEITFLGHHYWSFHHDVHCLMEVKYGIPRLPLLPINRRKFFETFEIVFGNTDPEAQERAHLFALECCRQKHGTVLVISHDAANEANRLAKQAIPIDPALASPALLQCVTRIDGAVLLDLEGRCFALGAILDGEAIDFGDRGRGSRYNSCLRYLAARQTAGIPVIIIVVSEDGTSDILPDLPDRLERSILASKQAELEAWLKSDDPSLDRSYPLLRWLNTHRFYLDGALCEKANQLSSRHQELARAEGCIFIAYSQFTPSDEMSDVFLKDSSP